jgi:predicted HicB family RNase H-like nuclease
MSEIKPFASLNPTLLARKGGAKPAMRSQMAVAALAQHEDLGWNDLGHDAGGPAGGAEIYHLSPEGAEVPEVLLRQQEIHRRMAAKRRSALADGRRAAFTLRVDAERHLKLRLACTLTGRSAQQLVTEALDQLLDNLPDVAELAASVAKTRK